MWGCEKGSHGGASGLLGIGCYGGANGGGAGIRDRSAAALTYSILTGIDDANPYGVVIPGPAFKGGTVQPGDILVANFNNAACLMGTGSTFVRIDASGNISTFYTASPANIGLDNALDLFKAGFEVIGNMPITYADDNTVVSYRRWATHFSG